MLRSLKQLAFLGADATGMIVRARDSAWRQRRLLILCYHGISIDDEDRWNPSLYMSPQRFRDRLRQLRDGAFNVIPFSEGVRRMYEGTLPPRAVALTFDDGAHDFAVRAVPILSEFGYPATVYLTTYYCRFQRPVFDTMFVYLLWKSGVTEFDGTDLILGGGRIRVTNHEERVAFMLRVRDEAYARKLTGEMKDSLLRRLAERIGIDYDAILRRRLLHIMTPDQAAALPRDLIDVQLHTHRHRTPREQAPFQREIRDNRREIASLIETRVALEHFCYPSGYYQPEFLPWLRNEGVTTATTCIPGIACPHDDPLLLPRLVDTMHISPLVFSAWLAGFAAWLPRRAVAPPPGA